MNFKKVFKSGLMMAALGATCISCGGGTTVNSNEEVKVKEIKTEMKKYTNADFYVDGKFNEALAKEAYKELIVANGGEWTPFLEENFWVAEFNLGDFENVGMGGVFWINHETGKYFAHEIYLLPGQMIPEHAHMATEKWAAKMETWHVRSGNIYCFGEGDKTPGGEEIVPVSQHEHQTVFNYVEVKRGELNTLNREEAFHFMVAGPEGAIVSEYANYHEGGALRFSNPAVQF